ncbi:MAG: DJ-1 family glyoxalase III [Acutalibacteraceae bacterium]
MFYCFLADGFEETEALATVDVLRRAKIDVTTVGVGAKTVTSSHNIPVVADITDRELNTADISGVILPGGMPGTLNLEKSDAVKKSVALCAEKNLFICAICAAPSILGHMGLLSGKKATCFPGFEDELIGAEYTGECVTTDGKIITGKGAGAAVDFGLEIVSNVLDKQTSQKIREALQCP